MPVKRKDDFIMDFSVKQEIIVLFASPYRIVDERTGEVNEGISVSYLLDPKFKPVEGANGQIGLKPAKASIETLELPNLIKAPALYEGTFNLKVGSNNKPELALQKVRYIGEVFPEQKAVKTEPDSQDSNAGNHSKK